MAALSQLFAQEYDLENQAFGLVWFGFSVLYLEVFIDGIFHSSVTNHPNNVKNMTVAIIKVGYDRNYLLGNKYLLASIYTGY